MRVFQIDSFTDRPFAGNPAAVVLLDEPRDAAWMQSVAAEMNLAETAFLEPGGAGFERSAGVYRLRWFTPTVEVDLCGHATLASAHALWEVGAAPTTLRFETRSGELTAERAGDEIVLDFPVDPVSAVDEAVGADVAKALGVAPSWVGRSGSKYLALLDDEPAVLAVAPDFPSVRALDAMGVIVTASAGERSGSADFVSRFFAPAVGIDEDPVTGAAHCCLAPFWVDRLGRNPLLGYQASARGGFVGVTLDGSRVRLSGKAVTVLRGEID